MQQTDYSAIVANAQFFKSKIGNAKLCAVIKNNAYGHGIVRTASALRGIADFFAVGSVVEALQVQYFSSNVLILLPLFGKDIQTAVSHGFVLTVDSFETLRRIVENVPQGAIARVHLKIQTGMNRLGFELAELHRLCALLVNSKCVAVEGVFSHFYAENAACCDKQFLAFNVACNTISHVLKQPLIKHISNTSATLLNSKYHLDMVRVGLGLYGYGCENLVVAKTVTAKIVAVRSVFKGQNVGYGGNYLVPADTNIAVLQCGYANGFPRALVGAKVKIGNQLFPVVGNICMAMCMVDVGNANVCVGEEAVLLGCGTNNANSQVIVYELLCNLQ